MAESVLIENKLMPYCPGCGHRIAATGITGALEKLGLKPLDVVVVSDIGCCGIIDALLNCHTVHGLHGRACALATGVAFGLDNPRKKVIAIQGDGGSTIGLQHFLEASRQNVDLTLIVHNNQVYGMTGGQISGLSSTDLKSIKLPDSAAIPPYDICELAYRAGASYSARFVGRGDLSDKLAEAFGTEGFSLVEIVGLCPAYGAKKMSDLEGPGHQEVVLRNRRPATRIRRRDTSSLLEAVPGIAVGFSSELETRVGIMIAGSAGEGVQVAGELLARAGAAAGLRSTKKGEYPITVGTGFSLAEVILSPGEIHFTGIESPDVMIATSKDGWELARNRMGENTHLVIDETLESPACKRKTVGNFRSVAGRRGAAFCAIASWLETSGALPLEALREAARAHKHADKLTAAIESSRSVEKTDAG